MLRRLILYVIIAVFALGCAAPSLPRNPENYRDDKENGLVIGSLSFPKQEAMFNGYFLRIIPQDSASNARVKEFHFSPDEGWKVKHSGQMNDKKTYLFTISRPAGNYAISGIRLATNLGMALRNDMVNFTIPFEVNAGEAVYIGEIYFDEYAVAGDTVIRLNDKYERDIEFVKRWKPNVDWAVKKSSLQLN